MAHLTLNQYLQQVDSAWRNKDGQLLSEYLTFRHAHVASSKLQLQNPESNVERVLEPPLDEIVAAHLRCIWALNNQDFVEAYCCQTLVVQAFTKVLQTQRDQNWSLPVMYAVCIDLRLLAMQADRQLNARGVGRPMETIEKAAECLMGCFRVCAADNRASEEYTKRWGMLALVNQLFKVYFRINKLHLCKPLIRAIESSPFKDQFSLSQQITYRYYVGRTAMFDSDYKTADTFLTFAFARCHKKSIRNKRLTLIYLVPVKMLLGYMPTKGVLEKYDLLQFWEVTEAVKQGNIMQLNKVMQRHEPFFIKFGIYLILEKLKCITVRNLFKRVHDMLKIHHIPVSALLTALKMMEIEDVDSEETQCIIANLIHDGKIKGYISHSHQVLVVSKQKAFPALSTVL
ncbi:PCI domain-containing protein 2 [Anabrus simplex]|uniref:PCI domain-containing protein 2 n=1 Tax=Anabrus simplex TaxID=316456 RepID=UPI0034DCC957